MCVSACVYVRTCVYACVCPYVYAYVCLCVWPPQNEGHMLSISNYQPTEGHHLPCEWQPEPTPH